MSVQIGDTISDLTAESTAGVIRLSALRGSHLVLYFYPKDDTPGCTNQAGDFRDQHAEFQSAGAVVLGVSRDSLASHHRFKSKIGMPFELISDPDEALCEAFGVMKLKTMYGRPARGIERSTFVIDAAGKLVRAWRGVKVPRHVEEVLAFVRSLPR